MPHTALHDNGFGAFGCHHVVSMLYCYLVPLKKDSNNLISNMESGITDSDATNKVDELMFPFKDKKRFLFQKEDLRSGI